MRIKLYFILALLLAAAAIPASAQSTATINFGTTSQTIRGFGGATAWMPALSSTQANALFGTGAGQLGLTIHRMRIDDSSTTGGSSNWGAELTSAQEAAALGAINIASPWGAPAAWKSNNSTVQGSLLTSHYADYANYLESFVTFMKNGGVNLYAISMQNEPDATVTYDSMVWNGSQMDTWVANNSSVLTTKLMMPESESFITSLSDPALNDSNAVGKIGIIAGHIYGVQPSFYSNAVSKGKEVWMTEHYLTPSGSQPAIGDAIAAAEEVHNSLVTAQYNAYVWWWILDWNPGSGVTNFGLIDTNSNPTYYGYALAQFSKFVRPDTLDRLTELNSGDARQFLLAGRLDLTRVASMGHSAGAEYAARAGQLDARFKACVDLDGGMVPVAALPDFGDGATMKQPLLFLEGDHPESPTDQPHSRNAMAGTHAQIAEYRKKKEEQLESCPLGSYAVELKSPGMVHGSASDQPLLAAGNQDSEVRVALHNLDLIEVFIRAFLDKHLRQAKAPLLEGASALPPEATVRPYGH